MTVKTRKCKIVTLVGLRTHETSDCYHYHQYSCGHEALVGPYNEENHSYHWQKSTERMRAREKYRCWVCGEEAAQ